ncbi:MAG: ABC transporter permease subunit [Roseobacter sp.]
MKVQTRTPLSRAFDHVILLGGLVFLLLPVMLLGLAATHSTGALAQSGLTFQIGDSAGDNFASALSLTTGLTDQVSFWQMMLNSMVLALGVAGLTTLLSFAAAYSIVYFKQPLANTFLWVSLATLLLPIESRFLPTFEVAASLGLVNSHVGMILPVLAFGLGTLFFRQGFISLPETLLEAARLDGAGPFRFWIDFIVPLTARRAGAVFIVTFMIGWNQYLWPLLMSTQENHYTVLRGLRLVGIESGAGVAFAVLSILPALVLFIVFQRFVLGDLHMKAGVHD